MQGSASVWLRSGLLVVAACLSLHATNHQIRFDEILAGLNGDPNVQCIVLVANGNGQKDWGPQGGEIESRAMLVFSDGAGNQTATFKFPNDPPDGANTVLIATAAFTNRTGLRADIVIPPLLTPGSGKVCFKGNPANPAHFHVNLCVSYGSFPPNLTEGAGPPAPALPSTGEPLGLVRFQSFIFLDTTLNADFRLGTPHPTNTANQTTAFVGPGPTIGASPPAVEFPATIFPGSNLVQRGIGLRNFGTANALTITSLTFETNAQNDFTVLADSGEGILAPGGARNLTIGFFPRGAGMRRATLRVQSNDPEQPMLAVGVSARVVNIDPCAPPDLAGAFAQNACNDALPIGPGIVYSGSNAGATGDGFAPCNQGALNNPDVWFKYIAGGNGNLNVSFAGSDNNLSASIQRACSGNTNVIFCNVAGLLIPFNIFVTNGQMLLIRLSSRSNLVTNFRLLLTGPPAFDADRNKNGRNDACEFDFGDAPAPGFPTLNAANGARHRINNDLFLGRFRDADADGQPSAAADGDNRDGERNDEDGVTVSSPLVPGSLCTLTVFTTGPGFLSGWLDFNGDGDWNDASERVFDNVLMIPGENKRGFLAPSNAVPGAAIARFRFSGAGNLGPEGLAEDGEVEDYAFEILDPNAAPTSIKVRFNEIMAGLNGDSTVQFVEMQSLDDSHKNWAGARLVFFDALGRQTGRFAFPGNAPPGQDTVLIATRKFAEVTGLQPDFIMPPALMAVSGKVVFRTGAESIALAYGGHGYYGTTDGAGPPNEDQLPILGAQSLAAFNSVPFGLNQNIAFRLMAPTPRNTAGQLAVLPADAIIEQGRRLFAQETFNGNGRTCQTCHQPGRDQFGLSAATVHSMPADDPLFVFEPNINILRLTTASFPGDLRGPIAGSSGTARILAGSAETYYVVGGSNLAGTISDTNGNTGVFSSFQPGDLSGPNPRNGSLLGLEDPALLRGPRTLVLENIDGFTHREVFRESPHLLNIKFTAPFGLSGEFNDLGEFSDGAVVQHFSRSLERVPDRDFRHPTEAELDAMVAFMESLTQPRDEDFFLSRFATTEAQKRGMGLFFSNESKCSKCHSGRVLATADGSLTGTVSGRNENFNTGVANQLTNLLALATEPAGLTPGQSTREFSTPPLFGIRLTPPFFHDGSAATLTEAVRFYDSSTFVASPAGDLVGAVPAANQPDKVADIVAFLESLVELPVDFTDELDFGVLCFTGQPPANLFASVTNIGTSNIVITAVQIAGTNAAQFQVVGDTAQTNLAPGEVRRMEIAFAATANGISQATLEFSAEVPGIPGSVNFGAVLVGAVAEAQVGVFPPQLTFAPKNIDTFGIATQQVFTITNFGPGEAILRDVRVATNVADFQITLADGLPIRIPANGFTTLRVTFDAARRGLKTNLLTLDLAACNLQHVELPISALATSRVHHFTFTPINSPAPLDVPFPLALTARDHNEDIVTEYSGPVQLNVHKVFGSMPPALLITEIDPGNPDRIEIMNLSGGAFSLRDWQVQLYDSSSTPRSIIKLPDALFNPTAIFTITEGGVFPGSFPNLFTGTNLTWIGGSDQIAVLLLDHQTNIVDFVTTGSPTNFVLPVPIPGDHWRGPGVSLVVEDGVTSYQRFGTTDHNDARDWLAGPITIGSGNADLFSFGFSSFGSIPASLRTVVLTNGAWGGEISIFAEAANVRFAAADAAGLLGNTAPFNVAGTPPSFEDLPAGVISMVEDVLPPLISFRIADLETPIDKLTVTAGSHNPTFIPATNFVLQGTGALRTLQIHLPTNFFGDGSIWIAVSDGPNVLVHTLDVSIQPVADAPRIVFSSLREDFDSVLVPALPTGWTNSGLWQTATNNHHSAPNAAFMPNPAFTNDSRLDSPEFFVLGTNAQLVFHHSFNTEPCCDGGVLELSIAGQSFANISLLGGTFLSGGPNHGPSIGWRGFGPNFTTVVRLPNATVGKFNRLRWRFTSNATVGFQGWSVDSIRIIEPEPVSLVIDEDGLVRAPFTIEDPDQSETAPVVTVTSSDQTLLPAGNLELLGSGFSRVLVARPATNQSGFTEITLNVSDETGPISLTLPLQVRSINDPPAVNPTPNRTIFAGNLLEQQITGVDPDGTNTVRYAIVQPTLGALINLTNGFFTWRPTASQAGSNFFRIQVFENSTPTVSSTQTFSVVVLPMPLAAAPQAFGTQCVAQAAMHRTVIITNTTANVVSISAISITGSNAADFILLETNTTALVPGERRPIEIEFTPRSLGHKQGFLEIAGQVSAQPLSFLFQVNLTAASLDLAVEITPAVLDFGEVDVLDSQAPFQDIVIRNIGQSPLRIRQTQVISNFADFVFSGVEFITLTNQQSHTVRLRFNPTTRGIKNNSLLIGTDACVSNSWLIPIIARGTSTVNHFAFSALGHQRYDTPFPVQITARDINSEAVTEFAGPLWLQTANHSPVLITEIDPGIVDRVEFSNVSTHPVDLTGWQIVLYDPPSAVKSVVTIPSGVVAAGEIFSVQEGGTTPGALPSFLTGNLLDWTGNDTRLAVLLRNAAGEIMDFFATTSVTHFVDPIPITPYEWSWPGVPGVITEGVVGYSRSGSIDRNSAADWQIFSLSFGLRNSGLSAVFPMVEERALTNVFTFSNGVATAAFRIPTERPLVQLLATDGQGRVAISSAFAVTGAPPTVVGLPATLDLLEDFSPRTIAFQVTDAETPLSELIIGMRSSNSNLNAVVTGNSTNRELRLTSVTNRFGPTTISIDATDRVQLMTANLLVNVQAVNDPPVLALLRQGSIFEDFDLVTPPALPFSWTTTSTVAVAWHTTAAERDSPPHSAFVPNISTSSDISLVSPSFAVGANAPILSFRHKFSTEICCDQARLEMAIGTNAFLNITALGVSFSANGYNNISAWSGSSGGFLTSTIQLPAASLGQMARLRWRLTTDGSVPGEGWWVDTITVTNLLSPNPSVIALNEDTPALAQFTVFDVESGSDDLHLSAGSSNPLLIPAGNIAFSGTGSNRVITLAPAANAFGTGVVQIVVSDGLANATAQLQFNYVPVNDLPILPGISNVTIHALTPLAMPLQGFDPDQTPVVYELLTPQPGASVLAGVFRWTPLATDLGAHTFDVRAMDTQVPGFDDESFTVTVVPTLVLGAARLSETGGAILTWNTFAGARYRLQHTANLASANWTDLAEITAATSPFTFNDPLPPAPQRFYRLLFLP